MFESWEGLWATAALSTESGCDVKANHLHLILRRRLGLWKVLCESPGRSPVSSQDQHGAEDAHVVSYQLHLVPELHLASAVPVAQVAVDEQDHQRQDGGQDLRRQADVAAREEGQSQHPKQHLQQHQSDLSSHYVVQIGLPVLFAVLQGVHLVGRKWHCVI